MQSITSPELVRIELELELKYEVAQHGADFIFNIHAAHTASQTLASETLRISQRIPPAMYTDPVTGNRYLRLRAMPGPLTVSYAATVDLVHHRAEPADVPEVPIHRIPPQVLGYIYPSRYCESDRLLTLVLGEFGRLPHGYLRVQAIRDWVRDHVAFRSRSSSATTSAIDTLVDRVGVCRDFAHLMIAMCRALNIPARFTTGTDYGADPVLGPPDFHAYVEVWLGDRWYMFDPSGTAIPMGFVRFGTGRDAADVAFATIFGGVQSEPPLVRCTAVQDASRGLVLPYPCTQALSTDAGLHY